ncbi:MAG: response regulator [Oscillospiraceae bacterium]|nr:response regulator [Oscillospiraceae bacterium]
MTNLERSGCVLIADVDMFFQRNCKQALAKHGIHVVCLENNGKKVLDIIKNNKPDVVVLNVVMSLFDAISVMQISRESKVKQPQFIVVSYDDDALLKRDNIEAGASEYLVKPFEISILTSKILQMINYDANTDLEVVKQTAAENAKIPLIELEILIARMILDLGVPPHIKGYTYLKEAIMFAFKNCPTKVSVTKDIYPAVAQVNQSTSACVERAIRHAIALAWLLSGKTPEKKLVEKMFLARPTNSQIISYVVNEIRMNTSRVV